MYFLPFRVRVFRIEGDGIFVRVEDTSHELGGPNREPRALHVGHTFCEVQLFQWFNPPRSDTNPWPLQLWTVDLRILNSLIGGTPQERSYPGDSVWLKLSDPTGTGIPTIATALSLVVEPGQGVGLR